MIYKLTVVRVMDNPRYDAAKALEASENARRGYGNFSGYTELPTVETATLTVELTEDEFDNVKRAVIEGWK